MEKVKRRMKNKEELQGMYEHGLQILDETDNKQYADAIRQKLEKERVKNKELTKECEEACDNIIKLTLELQKLKQEEK